MTADVFSVADIRKLIETFPPPDPTPGKTCLVRSRSGKTLFRSDAIVTRFKHLIQTSSIPILVSSLPNELGVRDVQWLLDQEASSLFYNLDRQRLLTYSRHRQILHLLNQELQAGGVNLFKWAARNDVGPDSIRRLVDQEPTMVLEILDDGLSYKKEHLDEVRDYAVGLIRDANESTVRFDRSDPRAHGVPNTYLEGLCLKVLSEAKGGLQGTIERRADGVYYTPQSAISQLQRKRDEARKDYVERASTALIDHGYVHVTFSKRPEILRTTPDDQKVDFYEDIQDAFKQKRGDHALLRLPAASEEGTKDTASYFIVQQKAITSTQDALAMKAATVAAVVWEGRVAGQDVLFDDDAVSKIATEDEGRPDASLFHQSVLESEHGDGVKHVFEAKTTELQALTAQKLAKVVRTRLLAPLQLYAKGAETIADESLRSRILEFVTDWARRTLCVETLLVIKDDKLCTTKPSLRDVDKFSEAIKAAKTLDEVNAAASKLARKQKIDQPGPDTLAEIKQAILKEKIAGIGRMKRSSDLLQNVTWILLAAARDGLFMSSGKDTSRMIKLYQLGGDAETAKRMGELRDIIKQGKDTEKEKSDMRRMAVAAVE